MFEAAARISKYAVLAGLAVALLARLSDNMVDLDIWHQMALAREVFSSGRFIYSDPFAYTPTLDHFIQHEWGAGVVAYLLTSWFGSPAILILNYLVLAGVMVFCLRCARRAAGSFENWGYLCLPALMLLSLGFLLPIRAQTYTYLFLSWLLYNLSRDDEGNRAWIVPWVAAFPVWANLHGGCVLGIVFTGAYWFEQFLRGKRHAHLLGVSAAMLLLLAANPYGFSYYGYLWRALTMPRPRITEWAPVWASASPPLFAFGICVLLLAYGIAAGGRRLLPGVSIVLAAACAAALHRKMLPVFAIAWLCYVPGYLRASGLGDAIARSIPRYRHVSIAVWLVLIVAFSQMVLAGRFWELRVPGSRTAPAAFDPVYPVGAVEYLERNRFAGNIMTPFGYGAYVSWKLHPEVRVSMDSRYETAYPNWLFDQVLDFYQARLGWENTLAKYPTDLVLLPQDSRLADVIPASGWRRVYSDEEYAIYARPGVELPAEVRQGRVPDGSLP
jgi:hypothetical protein